MIILCVVVAPLGTCEEKSKESASLENSLLDYLMPTDLPPDSKENTPAAASPNLRSK